MPASASRSSGAPLASRFTFTPALALASCQPPPWPQPCGSATAPGVISSVTATGTSTAPDFDSSRRGAAVLEPVCRGVVGVDPQRLDAVAAHQQRRVVHPRVV